MSCTNLYACKGPVLRLLVAMMVVSVSGIDTAVQLGRTSVAAADRHSLAGRILEPAASLRVVRQSPTYQPLRIPDDAHIRPEAKMGVENEVGYQSIVRPDRMVDMGKRSYWTPLVITFFIFCLIVPVAMMGLLFLWDFIGDKEVVEAVKANKQLHDDLYETWASTTASPGNQILAFMKFEGHGGLSKVKELSPDGPKVGRIISCICKLGAAVFNVVAIFYLSSEVILGSMAYYGYHQDQIMDDLPDVIKEYMESITQGSLVLVWHTVIVAIVDLFGLLILYARFLHKLLVFFMLKTDPSGQYKAFYALFKMFDLVNQLGTFSSLRLISFVHPFLIGREFQSNMSQPFFRNQSGSRLFQAFWFFTSRTCALCLGLIAFSVKLALVSIELHVPNPDVENPRLEKFYRWFVIFSLLQQTIGALHVHRILMWRMLQLIAVGSDGQDIPHGDALQDVYLAKLAKAMWSEYWEKGQHASCVVLLFTFDDLDLQQLLFDADKAMLAEQVNRLQKITNRRRLDVDNQT